MGKSNAMAGTCLCASAPRQRGRASRIESAASSVRSEAETDLLRKKVIIGVRSANGPSGQCRPGVSLRCWEPTPCSGQS